MLLNLDSLAFILDSQAGLPTHKHFGALTYGEILPDSLEGLIHRYPLQPQDWVLDLGSGLGKPVIQFFAQSHAGVVHGIEYEADLHAGALENRAALAARFPSLFQGRTFKLEQGDFLALDWGAPTVLFMCSTAFGDALMAAIGRKIAQYPTIRCIYTLRPLIRAPKNLSFARAVLLEGSWDSVLCYIYDLS